MARIPRPLVALDLSRRNRLVAYYLSALVGLVLTYTVLYNVALWQLESVDQSIFASFEFIVQTMTTTGYGQDSELWSHPAMFLFVSLMQISGIALGFFTLRLIIIPLFTGAEVNLDNRLSPKSEHVIICGYDRDSAVLLDELRDLEVSYVLIVEEESQAKALSDDGYAVIHGSAQDPHTLERASIDTARTVITDEGDANVNTILTVRSIDPDIEIITLTDDSSMREVLLDTGADTVLSPHGVLGHRLAEKAVSSITAQLSDTIELGGEIELTEIPVHPGSPLVGTRIRNSQVRAETGANIIGAWIDGELQLPPDPDAVIRSNTVLLVSGGHAALEAITDVTRPRRTPGQHEEIVIAGHGEVGQAARDVVTAEGIDVVTIDTDETADVDVVGDAGRRDTLEAAGVGSADAVLVALPEDSRALLTTVLARSLNPDVEILVRVTATDATRKALSAGADYVLSVPRVSARMVINELRGEDVLAPATQIRLLRVPATPFAGSTLADSDLYERTGCRVLAVEDEAGFTSNVDPTRRFSGDERIVIVGSDEAITRFRTEYDVSPVDADDGAA
jgi:Trk K+ transport system NAD-binding subunit